VRFPALADDPTEDSTASGWWAGWYGMSEAERARVHRYVPGWWGVVTRDTTEMATVMLPPLLYDRLDEFGIDFNLVYPALPPRLLTHRLDGFGMAFSVVSPSLGLRFFDSADEALRRGACRALNRYNADMFDGLRDRLEPVGVVPMHTPEEGIEELEHAVAAG